MLGQSFYGKITECTLQGSLITRAIAETNIPRTLFSVAPIRRLIPFLEYITREGTSVKHCFSLTKEKNLNIIHSENY